MLGGFQLMISRTSKSKSAGIELIKFLTSPEIQRVNAISRGYAPTRSALYKDRKVLQVNPLFGPLRNVLEAGAAVRPSTAAGPQYEKLSTLYFTVMREALLGKKTADDAVRELEKQLPKVSFSR
jgi:ABC-type glycerol-3-phosphate transport system substrate-binding protein